MRDLFSISMEWCYYISTLPLISGLMKAGCLFLYRSVSPNPFHFESLQSFITLSVGPFITFFSLVPHFYMHFCWSAWRGVILPPFLLCSSLSVPVIYSSHYLGLLLTPSVSEPSPYCCQIPSFSAASHRLSALSHRCGRCPYLPVPPSFFLCFSLAVWVCPSPNRLSHLNDGCLRLDWHPRSDSFSLCHGVK